MLMQILPVFGIMRMTKIHGASNPGLDMFSVLQTVQNEIAVSTMEAEYIMLSQSMHNLLPMCYFIMEILNNLFINFKGSWTCSTIFEDNNGALVLASSPKMTLRFKHIAIKCHFFRRSDSKKDSNSKRNSTHCFNQS